MDPEDLREVVRAYQQTCAEVIQRFEGHIAQLLGDALLVYFGWPQAHEDDAQRAVRTGVDMLDAMGMLNTRLEQDKGVRLAIRVGIHTGLVVVGEMGSGGHQEQLALGDTPNVASRLQGMAEPNTVAISAATFHLVEGYFTVADLGLHTLKGVTAPMQVYRVLQASGAQSRLDVAATRGLTPLVGREQEVGLLVERWAHVKEGMGQVVVLNGEAGIGKSRLVQVVKDHVAGVPHFRWECRCSPYYHNSVFYPVIDLFQRAFRFQRDDAPVEKLRKMERTLAPYNVSLGEVVPLFASMLSVPCHDHYPPLTLTPERQKQKTLEATLTLLLALAAQQPVLFILEDLHWTDPSTLELLDLLMDQTPTTSIFTLLTCRPTFQPPWGSRSYLTHITLNRLSGYQVEQIVEKIAGGKCLPAEILQQIVAKTDGVPLYVEEFTKAVLESGFLRDAEDHYELTGPLPLLAIPATLHDSLMARLDRLVTAKGVAQLGATIGRQFSYGLLQAIAPLDEATLQRELGRLVDAELLYQRGVSPQATYMFKHALIQEAAYQSLLRSTRQQYHQRTAQILATQFPETVDTQPELLAHHYTEAGLTPQALGYWQHAGQRAIQRSANMEAIGHLTKGLEALATLPDTAARIQHELQMQLTLGPALMAARGYGAPEVGRTYARAYELCQHGGDTQQRFQALWGLWRFYVVGREVAQACPLADQLLVLAKQTDDAVFLLEANNASGITLFYLGEFTQALSHLEAAMALYDPEQHRALAFLYGQDPGVICHVFAALALWMLGYPEQALQRCQEALACARDPFSQAYALFWTALPPQFCGRRQMVHDQAETAIALSTEQGFTLWRVGGIILQGWARAHQGHAEEGRAQVSQGLVDWRATESKRPQPYLLALLGETYKQTGQAGEGLTVLADALAEAEHHGERWWEAEIHRLKGELLLAQIPRKESEAEACFQQAINIAAGQQAKSLELRATVSLGHLWQQQGKHEQAEQLLAPLYAWFTEGFETADLTEAKALLEELALQK